MEKENFFNKDIYDYVISRQTSRLKFYVVSILVLGVMIGNELQFYYQSTQFNVIGCKNVTDYSSYYDSYEEPIFSTLNEKSYSISNCIQNQVQFCIPAIYNSNSNESLSFSIPLFIRPSSTLGQDFSLDMGYVYTSSVIFVIIMVLLFETERQSYVLRSRAHLLLAMNILVKPKSRRSQFKMAATLIGLASIYSLLKYMITSGLQKDASIIECMDKQYVALFFEGKSETSFYQIALNLALFILIFKNLISSNFINFNQYYEELTLPPLILSKNSFKSMDKLKKVKYSTRETILFAIKVYIDKKYPQGSISNFERKRRHRVFTYFMTTKVDFIPAIQEFYEANPDLFISATTSDQIDLEVNDKQIDETSNLIN